jgi:integrase/recombinase XerD
VLSKTATNQKWALASYELQDAYTDFILSRQAILCSPATLKFYQSTAGKFISYLAENGVLEPGLTSARHVRAYLSLLTERKLSDSYINGHARAIRTLLRFWYVEKYIKELISFQMPQIKQKRLLVYSALEIKKIISHCTNKRDKALIYLLTDTGLRRAELCALNWENVDISSGLVRVIEGKGGKARSVVMGIKTRRALLSYRREITHNDSEPVIQTIYGTRLSHGGLRSALLRLSQRANIHVTPHALRRTFATLSLRAGMNLLQLQAILGHSSLDMTRQYVHLIDDDLVEAHKAHGPIDNLL